MRRNEERSKQSQTNNKAKQHSTPKTCITKRRGGDTPPHLEDEGEVELEALGVLRFDVLRDPLHQPPEKLMSVQKILLVGSEAGNELGMRREIYWEINGKCCGK